MYNNEPIFLAPVFKKRLWGGTRLRTLFNYKIPDEQTGEAWIVAAHKQGNTKVLNGPLKGWGLQEVWQQYPALFGKEENKKEFPLLIKMLDAKEYLSVQVHPNDHFANRIENEPHGKTECWYVLDCEKEAEIIYGHHAVNKDIFKQKVQDADWHRLLRRVQVQKGDFFYVPSGTVHAIGKGIVILEVQQNSDITYRVYDYGRIDADGNKRALHLEKALAVINTPDNFIQAEPSEQVKGDVVEKLLVRSAYFTVSHWELSGSIKKELTADYTLMTVIDGKGSLQINGRKHIFRKGDSFILFAVMKDICIKGRCEFIVTNE